MRRKFLSMRISAVIMAAVLSMSLVTVYADTTNEHILEGDSPIEVTLPASINLSRDGNKYTGSGSVSARYVNGGASNSLVVSVDTSVDYINTEDSSKKVTGSVSFGESGVGVWSVDELLHTPDKDISVEVPAPKSFGTYEGVINYKINSFQQYDDRDYYADEKYFIYNKIGNMVEITGLTDLGWNWVRNSVTYTDSYDSPCIDKYIKDENTLLIPSYFKLEGEFYDISRVSIGAENSNGNISQIKKVVLLDYDILSLNDSYFAGCTALTNITIPDEVRNIRNECFKGCTALTNISLPDSMDSLGSYCFADCTALTKIKIPNGIDYIDSGTFANCTALTEVYIPDGVRDIYSGAFANCTNITKLHLPTTINDFSYDEFRDCYNIQTVYYDDSMDAFLESSLLDMLLRFGSPLLNAHWVFTDYELYLPSYLTDCFNTFQINEEIDLSEYEEMTLEADTNLYSYKDTDSEVFKKLKGNSKVYIISSEEEDNGIWYEVYSSDETRGWIFIRDSGVEGDIDLSQYEEMTIDVSVNLYSDRDTSSDIIQSLDAGTVVYVVSSEEADEGIWYEIYTSDEVKGWIFIEDSGAEEDSDEESTETEEETETEDSTDEETETEESTENETENEESTEEESSGESSDTDESSDESSENEESTEEDSDESSETEESSDDETDSEENAEIEDAEESTSFEDSESDESVEEQEELGVEIISEEAEEVIIEEDGEDVPSEGDSNIPQVLIEAEIKDEEQE